MAAEVLKIETLPFAAPGQGHCKQRGKRRRRRFYQVARRGAAQPPKVEEKHKFIIIAAKDCERKLSHFSCFAVHRALKSISNSIVSIHSMQDGNLRIVVPTQSEADKFMNTSELSGICEITCTLHENFYFARGLIYAPYLINIPVEEILRELSSHKVTHIYKFLNSSIGSNSKHSGLMLLTFNLLNLPKTIDISWYSVKVREFKRTPRQCRCCQRFGHTARFCRKTPICPNCGLAPHFSFPCTQVMCVNCFSDHPANSPHCPKYKEQLLKLQSAD